MIYKVMLIAYIYIGLYSENYGIFYIYFHKKKLNVVNMNHF